MIEFRVDQYTGGREYNGKYMVRNTQGVTNTYLCNDGVVRDWALTKHGDGSITIYDTIECANKALREYNFKENGMTKQQLTTGMGVTLAYKNKQYSYIVMLGTKNGDMLVGNGSSEHMRLDDYNDDLTFSDGDARWDIVEVQHTPSVGCIGKSVGNVIWTCPVPETVMTISEIEKKYGIINLKIAKESV